MVEASPASPFVVPEPDLLLEVLIIPLDAPAQFGQIDHLGERDVVGEGREPMFGRLRLALRPFDKQPFLGMQLGALVILMGRTNPHPREARCHVIVEPSRHVTEFQASAGRARAKAFTATG